MITTVTGRLEGKLETLVKGGKYIGLYSWFSIYLYITTVSAYILK
jgi:hypothetical protein